MGNNLIKPARLLVLISGAVALTAGCIAPAADSSPSPGEAASNKLREARGFAQGFYKWYLARAEQCGCAPTWNLAVNEKASSFSQGLLLELKEDLTAEAGAQGEVAGLDFDPFLNTQESTSVCSAGDTKREGDAKYLVSISCSSTDSANRQQSTITAEVSKVNGHWQFMDFRYSDGGSLRLVLSALRKSRARTK